ncbi:MAG: response regulator [Gemmatimonadaceae bacterium]|nr:response regulator [Gemmatimonadaceae bacterium]
MAWRDRLLRCTWTVELGEASESDSARERETTALRVLLERTLQQTDGTLTRCDGAGGGLDVGVEWPVADAAVPPLSPGGAATGDVTVETSPFSVLCVDDNPALLDALERRLQLAPQCRELRRAQDRISTLAALNARVPDVVLLDLQLSRGGDGELLLTEMLDRMPTLPVVIFAGRATGRQIRRLLSRGAAAFVSKGVAPAVLLDVLTRVVRGERQVIADDA